METLARAANRGSISTGYDIDNSLKFEAANNESLQRAAVTGNRRTFTQSCWLKRSSPGLIQQFICYGSFHHAMRCFIESSDDRLYVDIAGTPNALYRTITNRLFRDPSAWYHIVIAIDTTQSTEANRLKIYVNGVQETSFASQSLPAQNFDTLANIASSPGAVFGDMAIGALPNNSLNNRNNGYLAEAISVDGQALDPTSFGEFDEDSGIWKPINVSGLSFGNNGYYLDFKDSSNLGNDVSGGTDFTLTNITAADQATDTPTNNFATLNPLWVWTYGMGISDGATKVANTVTAWGGAKGSIGVTNGKWYWEHSSFSGSDTFFGIQNSSGTATQAYEQAYTVGLFMNVNSNIYFYDPSGRSESFSFTFAASDVWGIALDLDGNTISFYRNGSIVNSAVALDGIVGNGELFPFVSHYGGGHSSRINLGGYTGSTISSAASDANGYGTFEYAPPSGYYAIMH
jgi:hypothetical protein